MRNILLTLALLVSYTSVSSQCNLTLRSNSSSSKLLKGTNSSYINTKLDKERLLLKKAFDVEFKIEYYPGKVAFASPNCELSDFEKVSIVLKGKGASSCDGTIGLGVNMLKKLHSQDKKGGDWMILAVLSHEVAHIFQFKNKIKFNNTVQQEIHADIIAGWYMGKLMEDYKGKYDFSNGSSQAYNKMQDKVESISMWKQNLKLFFGELGDSNYSSIQHHGNFTTRLMAIHHGMKSYTKWASPISLITGESRDYKKLLMTYGKSDASHLIKEYNN
jgi:hypothetical protein